ncbi:MAG: hypothetical protein AB1679_18475 [Actinomycetota bacterium]|jgi:hypothetical protein
MIKKLMAALLAGGMLFGGIACDDNNTASKGKIDEDDTRVGPGDGQDEYGPGR